MNENELNKLYLINKEMDILKKQLLDIKSKSYCKGQRITGMPFANRTSDKVGDRAIAIREIEELYEKKLEELYQAKIKIEKYISEIEDMEIRLILRLRCINNMNWDDIGDEIGMDRRTASRKYNKYMKESKLAHNAHEDVI